MVDLSNSEVALHFYFYWKSYISLDDNLLVADSWLLTNIKTENLMLDVYWWILDILIPIFLSKTHFYHCKMLIFSKSQNEYIF